MLMGQLIERQSELARGGKGCWVYFVLTATGKVNVRIAHLPSPRFLPFSISAFPLIFPSWFVPLYHHLFPSPIVCFSANLSQLISFLVLQALLKHFPND